MTERGIADRIKIYLIKIIEQKENEMSNLERVKEVIMENLGVDEDELTEETNLVEDLGIDSLDMVELAMELEDEFDMSIEDEEMEKLATVKDIVEYIEND